MEFSTRIGNQAKIKTPCIVAGVYDKRKMSATAKLLDDASGGYIQTLLKKGDLAGRTGQSLLLHSVPGVNAERILLIGLGTKSTLDERKFRTIIQTSINRLKETNSRSAVICLLETKVESADSRWKTHRIVDLIEYNMYSFTEMKGKRKATKPSLTRLQIHVASRKDRTAVDKALTEGIAVAKGVTTARNLGNLPSNICTPAYLAREARKMGRTYQRITTSIVDEAGMKRLGMGAMLAVSAGSDNPAKLIVMRYRGAKGAVQPYVMVGKGLCFDSGGISLKSAGSMAEMIYDMCGAASVFGTIMAIAEMNLPINLVGVVAAAENMPSGKATKPGDIVKSMSGQTIEILNTDAEGRLVLCDALTYIDRFKPITVIDIATLTGACVVALGSHASGLFANDDHLANDLTKAADASGDRVWRLPIWEDYQSQLTSRFADMANVGGRPAGSIVAACFLARYTKRYRWAHLDIAGTGYQAGARKTATGRPVQLLTRYLLDRAGRSGR
ncbi:MAG: leucyl aminopeptidase [Pseudomonadales bacterium]|jgi:leucyl aminopeptidase|nr:leucyl aminopeptidase [Pseudomonadales bacterium]MDP7360615.1 leucyl aminopeptidase [Pseudomonadales bacterium]HJN51162.1 leucyl aminopeptidase [Pseudomonadales bacterium]|tara:strand:+ start:2328 stop:3830 length:1503 start_codon:yes stop_codon:yes gene_type:complete